MHPSSEILSAAADGELTSAERARHGAHLASCLSCAAHIRTLARFDRTIASAPAMTCDAAFALRSSAHDGELDAPASALLAAHDVSCGACTIQPAAGTAWTALDTALSAIPSAAPSARVDAYIARLVERGRARSAARRPRFAGGLLAGAGTLGLIVALVATQLIPVSPQAPDRAAELDAAVLVAGVQQVLDERTNTLYVLRPGTASVEAIDLATRDVIATVRVGGRPTALALDPSRSTIYVLDSAGRSVTEIDTQAKQVVGTVALTLPGTPTTISVDSANGKLVIGAVGASPAPSAGTRTAAPVGHVTVLDVTTKRVDTVRVLDVAPQSVVLDGAGKRALIVSADTTRVVDATTYASLEDLAGGIAAAFSSDDRHVAVLAAGGGGTVLRLSGTPAAGTITLRGTPVALVALPDGAFAALVQLGDRARVHVIGADGQERGSSDVDGRARELAYDSRQGRIAVLGAGQSYVSLVGSAIAGVAPSAPPASPSAPPPVAAASPTSPPPSSPPASPTPQASAPPVAAAPPTQAPALPAPARQIWPGAYFVETGAAGPRLVAGSAGRVWAHTAGGALAEVDTATGAFARTFRLPAGAQISSVLVGVGYVYAADREAGRLYVVSLADGELTDRALPFLRSTVALTVSGDDRLWLAMAESSALIVYDASTRRVETVDVGAGSISALVADRAGRLWFTDEARRVLSSYDIAQRRVTDLAVPYRGRATSLLADRNGTIWVGTDAGQLVGVRGTAITTQAGVGRPILALAQGPAGAWYLAEGADGARLGPVDFSRDAAAFPRGLRGLAFDPQGLAWSATSAGTGFYAVETRPRGP